MGVSVRSKLLGCSHLLRKKCLSTCPFCRWNICISPFCHLPTCVNLCCYCEHLITFGAPARAVGLTRAWMQCWLVILSLVPHKVPGAQGAISGMSGSWWSLSVKGSAERRGPGRGVRCWHLVATARHRAPHRGNPAGAVLRLTAPLQSATLFPFYKLIHYFLSC